MKINNRGFTIVELLIVIVVIGVLASIATVSANGIQQRATNTQLLATYQSVHKALSARLVSDGYFSITPLASGDSLPCIGEVTDHDSDGSKDCVVVDGAGAVHSDPLFDAGMSSVVSTMPGKHKPIQVTAGGGEKITIYNPNLVAFADVPPAQDTGDLAVMNTGQSIAYIFEGIMLGENQPCGSNSVEILGGAPNGVGGITYNFRYGNNAFGSGFWDGTTACYYAVLAP